MKLARRCVACEGDGLERSPAVLMPFVAWRVFGWEPTEIGPDWGLRDLKPGAAYSVCASVSCRDCGMLFLDMRFDDEEMAALYEDYRGEAYSNQRERFEPGYKARNSLLLDGSAYIEAVETFLRPHLETDRPRVLDWGGDTGVNTPFRTKSSRCDIYDISSRPLLPGAARVTRDDIQGVEYDLVVFANVLEHVSNPREAVAALAEAMGPRTLLYLEVPHEEVVRTIADPATRLRSKRHWHEHINFFTADALDVVFRQAGLRIVERISHPVFAGGKESHVFSIAACRL
jgi:hypothetical protein